MCAGPFASKPKSGPTQAELDAERQRQQQMEEENRKKKERAEDVALERAKKMKGGSGRRSLISGSSGGAGYLSEYSE